MLGVVFWGFAAHLAKPDQVGRASAEVAAMILLANLSQLSFTTILERFLPIAGKRSLHCTDSYVRSCRTLSP